MTPIITAVIIAGRIFLERLQNADDSLTTLKAACTNIFRMTSTQRTGMTSPPIVGVTGAGTIGSGVARVSALAGLWCELDVDTWRVAHGREAVATAFTGWSRKQTLRC